MPATAPRSTPDNSAAAKASAADELTEPGATQGNSAATATCSPVRTRPPQTLWAVDRTVRNWHHDRLTVAAMAPRRTLRNSAAAKAPAAVEIIEPGVPSEHSSSDAPFTFGLCKRYGSGRAVETGIKRGKSGGHSNSPQLSHSAAANVSAAPQPTGRNSGRGAGGARFRHEQAFHFKNQGAALHPRRALS